MIGSCQPSGKSMTAACPASLTSQLLALALLAFATLPVAGCGHDSNIGVALQPTPKQDIPALTGVVAAPNGEFAKAGRPWWPESLSFTPRAYALQNVLPIGDGSLVQLSLVDPLDAADGTLGNTGGHAPVPIAQTFTDPDGRYDILDEAVGNVATCGLMVAVGGGAQWTRAFVFSPVTNIDAVSEAVVRVVLERLTKAPSVQLCDFKVSGLQNVYDAVSVATFTASGESVADINEAAFLAASASARVKNAIDGATGVPVK